MKNYPRIHSLTTVGIRQHQEFDYQFHGFRTDFVGDSGSGKSMIADLLQLVFVGSEVFYSATEGADKREVDGMVLRSAQHRGADLGFVLVNVELGVKEFITIGAYLESTSKHTRSFIVQTGYDELKLQPLSKPMTVRDVLVNEEIPTFDLFKSTLENKSMVVHAFTPTKKFHSYLFRHKILPIDLSQSSRLLNDFAKIIQSFSRGKNLKLDDGNSLKLFLFGNEKAKEIAEKYRKAVEDLQTTLSEYTRNRLDIDLVSKKWGALQEVKRYRDEQENKHRLWITKRYAWNLQKQREAHEKASDLCRDFINGDHALQALKKLIDINLLLKEGTKSELKSDAALAKQAYDTAVNRFQRLQPFAAMIDRYDGSLETLKTTYPEQRGQNEKKKLLNRILNSLRQEDIDGLLDWILDFETRTELIAYLDNEIATSSAELAQMQALLDFTGINSKGSLGSWMIENYRPLTREVESVLMYYKSVMTAEMPHPKKGDQFIPEPDRFFDGIEIISDDSSGFWLANGQIRQFIPYITKQLFVAENISDLKEILGEVSKDIAQEMDTLKAKLKRWQKFKKITLDEPDFISFLGAYRNRKALEQFVFDTSFGVSPEEFQTGVDLLGEREEINAAHQHTLISWRQKQRLLDDHELFCKALSSASLQIERLDNQIKSAVEEIARTLNVAITIDPGNEKSLLSYYQSSLGREADKTAYINRLLKENGDKLKSVELMQVWKDYEKVSKETEETLRIARFQLMYEPDTSVFESGFVDEPVGESNAYTVARELYDSKFKEIVSAHVKGEAYKFAENRDYLELCLTILPEAFLSKEVEEEKAMETIEEYFTKINEKNKNLNTRKLQKIREILDEVNDEIDKRLDTVRQIHNFLNHEDREISGGHRVHLKADFEACLPKAWMDAYVEKLEQEQTLFDVGETLNDLLKDSISLDEKMLSAFYSFGGHKSLKPKIDDLLDPNAYFSLSFRMESSSGKVNSGSTGQTYAAIALLCIARLSLINKSTFNKTPLPGIRFMPIDEAEGLGSNFDMLYEIADKFDYQILTMSINPLGKFREGDQYIYILSNDKEHAEDVNFQPFAIFTDNDASNFVIA